MAQVIRKYQEGGKTKPTIVKIDGKDYNYDDIERNVWGNFEAHAKANNWDAETQNAVRDYLEYSLAGLKSGELSYGHNKMNNVSQEYESDGTFNTRGKGLFKRDITNDKRAGATLGTAYYNTLFNNNVMNEYKAPELKNIGSSLTQDIAKKIMDNNYGGNAEAMQEGWYKLTPQDRYTIFRQALADLNYSADEYKDVEGFNTKRANLLQLLENPYTDELNPEIEKAYAALGGYGLANLLKEEAKTSDTDELKPVSIEDKRKEWRQAAIAAGINTEQGIADYIALEERKYNELQNAPGEELKELQKIDQYKNVEQSLDNYVKWRKGDWYKRYSGLNANSYIGNSAKEGEFYDFSNFSEASFKKFLNQAIQDRYKGKINARIWKGLIKYLVDNGLTPTETTDTGNGGTRYKVYLIPGSEDYSNETVLGYTPNGMLRILSLHDFQNRYQKQLLNNFTKLYNQQNNANLSDNWLSDYLTLSNKYASRQSTTTQTSGQTTEQTQSNKNGGILKAQSGASLMYAALNQESAVDPTTQFWNNYRNIQSQKRQAEIDEASNQGLTVEELRKQKAEDAKLKKARDEKISSLEQLSGSDIARIAALGQDVGALVTSFAPGVGSVASGVLGVTSALTDLGADWFDDSVSTGQKWTNLAMNLGLAGVGMLPGGKSASIGTKLLKWAPKIITTLAAYNVAPQTINAFKKGQQKGFSNLTREEWKDIYYGLKIVTQGGAGAVRGYRNRWQNKNLTTTVEEPKTTIKTNKRDAVDITEHLEGIKGKSNKDATAYLKEKGVLQEGEELIQSLKSKALNKGSFGKLGKQFQITETKGTTRPMTPQEVEAKFGRIPGNYIDYMMRSPEFISKDGKYAKEFDTIIEAIGKDPKVYRTLAQIGQFNWVPLVKRLLDKTSFKFTGRVAQYGGTKKSIFESNQKGLATVEGQSARTVSQINAAELRAQNRARRAAAQRTEFSEFTPYRTRSLITRTESPLQASIMYGLNRGEYPLGLPTSRFTPGKPNYGTVFSTQPQFAGLSNPRVSMPSRPLLLEQRNTSSGNTSKLIRTKAEREKQIKFVQSALKDKNAVLVVDRNGNVMFATKDSKLQRISPNTKVTVKKGKETLEMSIADAMTQGYQITFNQQGGFISRVISLYQQGGSIPKYAGGNVVGTIYNNGQGTNWYDTVGSQYQEDLFAALENETDPKKRQELVDYINSMQDKHAQMYMRYNGSQAYYDPEVGTYQQSIIDKNPYVNSKGIINGRNSNRYSDPKIRTVGTDYDANHNFAADSYYGGQTDDRRLLGRKTTTKDDKTGQDKYVNDYTDEQIKTINERLKKSGLEMYLDPSNNYYKLRGLQNPSQNGNTNQTHVDPLTGEEVQYDPNTGQFKAVGNGNPQSKTKAQTIGEDVLNYIKNINPADAIALGRALWGENVNNKVAELTKQMQTALLDPQHQTAILHGNYNAKMLAQELAGKINAATQKPISSDAGTNYAARLEAAQKATQALQQGNAEDSEMYWKTLQMLNQVNDENAAQEVATGNENRSRVTAAYNNRLQAEAARLTANFEQIWQPFLAGVEKRYRDEDVLRRQAEIDNWKYKVTSEYEKKNDLIMENYKARQSQEAKNWNENNPKYKEYNGDFWNYFAREVSPEYQKQIKDVSREMYDVLYGGLSQYYTHTPFQLKRTPVIEVPGINGGIYRNYATKGLKSGGTLSAAERQALKTTNEINKNIRQAARETYKNIREDKREHRKAMALVSQLSADLIKKAVGIK